MVAKQNRFSIEQRVLCTINTNSTIFYIIFTWHFIRVGAKIPTYFCYEWNILNFYVISIEDYNAYLDNRNLNCIYPVIEYVGGN